MILQERKSIEVAYPSGIVGGSNGNSFGLASIRKVWNQADRSLRATWQLRSQLHTPALDNLDQAAIVMMGTAFRVDADR